jgi:hypothetical protein
VLWTADHFKPLVADLIPVAETLDIDAILKLAKNVSPEAVALCKEKAPWNVTAKTALNRSLPECLAKWLNAFGVSAEYREELVLVAALGSIAWGSYSLRRDLKEMAKENAERAAKTAVTARPQVSASANGTAIPPVREMPKET